MTDAPPPNKWTVLDRDLNRISKIELTAGFVARPLVGAGVALVFLVLAGFTALVFFGQAPGSFVVIAAAIFGGYMAINIGANDVSNNMGPAVGAKVLSMGVAITIAAIAESAGALLAGGEVVTTISRNIVAPEAVQDAQVFVWAMLAALIAAGLWVNIATWIGAPVSTTHSIVGGVMGAGISAAGFSAVNWPVMGTIAASWIISPVLSGIIAASLLALIRTRIQSRTDRMAAARSWVPVLVGITLGTFTLYLATKGMSRVGSLPLDTALAAALCAGLIGWGIGRQWVGARLDEMAGKRSSLKALFSLPLVIAATMLSFAHGANDVANAVGPLAAIVYATQSGDFATAVAVPAWVTAIGAFGISFGLFLFGPKLIRMVGSQITKLNPMRAFCVSLGAAITVLLASALGLPVSSTHVAVGGVFGVGFFREWDTARRSRPGLVLAREERRRRKLVRRSHFLTIIAAWAVTVPAAALLSLFLFRILWLIVSP